MVLLQRETSHPPLPRRPERECPEAARRHERAGDCEEQRRVGDERTVDNLRGDARDAPGRAEQPKRRATHL